VVREQNHHARFRDGGRVNLRSLENLDSIIEPLLTVGRVPGVAIAVVASGEMVLAQGYGFRDLEKTLPLSADTMYPIASTTKAMNTALLAMLVEDGRLAWDAPVQQYVPHFRLSDPLVSAQVTIRDLVTMRTGLPRHDWVWIDQPIERASLIERLKFLQPSAGFRERFQYNNLTATAAGHIAEIMCGQRWEEIVTERLFTPLEMTRTSVLTPTDSNVTRSYHENQRRELVLTQHLATHATAPSGGAVWSTVGDMARWAVFNLSEGRVAGHSLLDATTLHELHTPQMVVGADPSSPSPGATYAFGWFVDTYQGHARLSHGGYLHDVHSEVTLFPEPDIGIVSWTNFGPPRLASFINQGAFDLLMGLTSLRTLEQTLAEYEQKIDQMHIRYAAQRRVHPAPPSHAAALYAGAYLNPGYGRIDIEVQADALILKRHDLRLSLEHWHFDCWAAKDGDQFPIHTPHPFDAASLFVFDMDPGGDITAVSIALEPAVAPIRFVKQCPSI
jgi:CubicO group peptidase (beta-lactamase class C family)